MSYTNVHACRDAMSILIYNNNNSCFTKKANTCGTLKPQPGNLAFKKGYIPSKKRVYNCNTMINKVLKDNYDPETKKSRIKLSNFSDKCPKGFHKGSLVVDPFLGSGTTAKMCMENNRNYIGSEISKEYCEIIQKRLEPLKVWDKFGG